MLCAFKNFIKTALHSEQELEYEPPSSTAAPMRTREVPLVHVSCDIILSYTHSLHAINGLLAVGRMGNLLCGRPSYFQEKFECELIYFKLGAIVLT